MDERIEKMKAAFHGVFVGLAIGTAALAESGETPLPPAEPSVAQERDPP